MSALSTERVGGWAPGGAPLILVEVHKYCSHTVMQKTLDPRLMHIKILTMRVGTEVQNSCN